MCFFGVGLTILRRFRQIQKIGVLRGRVKLGRIKSGDERFFVFPWSLNKV